MNNSKKLSLVSRGSYAQFAVAVSLICFIPVLIVCLVTGPLKKTLGLSSFVVSVLIIISGLFVLLGFLILLKYPINIMRLRRTLEELSSGKIPDIEDVSLTKNEDDLAAIEGYMIRIVQQTEERISIIEQQSIRLVQMEKQRVIIESLARACHHLGQPMTVIMGYLDMINRHDLSEEIKEMVTSCSESAERAGDILNIFRSVTTFPAEPYPAEPKGESSGSDE